MSTEDVLQRLTSVASVKKLHAYVHGNPIPWKKKKQICDTLRILIMSHDDAIAIEAVQCLATDALWNSQNALWLEEQREQCITTRRIHLVETIDAVFEAKIAKGKARFIVRKLKGN